MPHDLFDKDFETTQPANPLFCHQEFLEKLQEFRNNPIGKRASLLMQRLAVDERRQHFKATQGINRGWRRSRLGGSSGSHFYAWWAPKTAQPLRDAQGFAGAPEGAIILRDIRHHDDHSLATAQSLAEHYLPVTVRDLRSDEYGPEPFTQPQVKFASARGMARTLKGHPGSGKTTALLHAADSANAERTLYVTYSSDLAALARQYFDRYCSKTRQFHVVTYDTFLRQLINEDVPRIPDAESRKKFQSDIYPYARHIAPWNDHLPALWDELHAHLIGAALPIAIGRFERSSDPRVSDRNFRNRRSRYLGEHAAAAAMDAAGRLERQSKQPLAERYFPELALAWRASKLFDSTCARIAPEYLDFQCIAIDECQDLTPIEAFVLIMLAVSASDMRKRPVSILLAGDEAQTVRATDFEWGWMNDILHTMMGSHSEFKLTSNLRSPQRIARLVNRVWDLYDYIEKRDRPSGTGYATIDDDANDQLLYCTSTAGAELNVLLENLAGREGLALISMDESLPANLPESVRSSILTPAEAKGLDFHSVCLLNAGAHLDRIVRLNEDRFALGQIESLRKRLAIDRLRVAMSRPTERLIWLDVNPQQKTVHAAIDFLQSAEYASRISPCIPAALLQTLEEEQFDIEERIQRCMSDARQYLSVKPDIAWSRAQQAVALLGEPIGFAGVRDRALRSAAYNTLSEICFCLAFRGTRLAPHLGSPDLFEEARRAAAYGDMSSISPVISAIGRVMRATPDNRLQALADLAQSLSTNKGRLEPWLITEIGAKTKFWVDELEGAAAMSSNAAVLMDILPPFYDALALPDAAARKERLRQRSLQVLIKSKRYAEALGILRESPERDYKLEGQCLDALGRYPEAGEAFKLAGDLKEAIRCYRSVPDFAAAFELMRQAGEHPAAESYEWLTKLNALIAEKPEKFNRVMLAPEKKLLEESLERALGVARKKAAPKASAPKKVPVTKTVTKKPAVPRARKSKVLDELF